MATTSNTLEYHRLRPDTPDLSSVNGIKQDSPPVPHRVPLPIKTPTVRYVPHSGLSRYKSALWTLLPFRRKQTNPDGLPIDNVGLFSYITFSWLMRIANQIDETNLPASSPLDSCDINGQRLQHIWREEGLRTGQKGLRMLTVMWRFVCIRAVVTILIYVLGVAISILGLVFCLRNLLKSSDSSEALAWTTGLILTELLSALFIAWSDSIACRTAVRFRSASASLVYNKLVRLSNLSTVSTQQMVSLLGTDGQKLHDAVLNGTSVITSLIVFICSLLSCMFILYDGNADLCIDMLFAVSVFVLTYPLLYVLVRLGGHLSARGTALSRRRMALLHEMLVHIRLVKMTIWENVLSRYLRETRRNEMRFMWRQFLCDGLNMAILHIIPIMALLLFLYTQLSERLDALKIVPLIAIFCGHLRNSLVLFWVGMKEVTNALPSLKRFKSVMLLAEANKFTEKPINRLMAVNISNANFVWDRVEPEHKKDKKKKRIPLSMVVEMDDIFTEHEHEQVPALTDITFLAPKGKLIGVCGLPKCGKTSLLLAILGHLHQTCGQVLRDGNCAYVGQRPWIWTASIRENIIFKEPFHHKRYYSCVQNCVLNEDIEDLPHHDDSQIDEMSLSPGQKQRIALARALYSNRDIYLLDNPLSMVDADMAATVFEKSILKTLHDRTVILTTRHVQFLTRCDEVYLLEKGKVTASGTHEELMLQCPQYSELVKMYTHENAKKYFVETNRRHSSVTSMTAFLHQHIKHAESADTVQSCEDEKEEFGMDDKNLTGPVGTYLAYLGSPCNYLLIIFALLTLMLSTVSLFGVPLTIVHFQAEWSDMATFVNIGLLLLVFFTSLLWSLSFTKIAVGISQRTHDSWFEKLCRAPVGYFQASPVMMCVLNLFSLNIRDLDFLLPTSLVQLLQESSYFMCIIFILLYLSPYCVAVIFVALVVTMLLLARPHRRCVLKIHALEVTSRGPLYQHVVNSISGRTYIQAFSKDKDFIADFTRKCDDNAICIYLLNAAKHWLAVRVKCIGAATVGGIALVVILVKPVVWSENFPHEWIIGIALLFVMQMGHCLHHIIQACSESEARLRMFAESSQCIQGIKNEGERIRTKLNSFPANWPTNGRIVFEDVKTAPLPSVRQVLNGMSFEISAGQKIGVVGLPGSGKKLLVDALFHLVDPVKGKILIGGTDIMNVPLGKLRSSIAIVPQDPVLFTGSIRLNLDPQRIYRDKELWECLQKVNLRERIELLPGQLNALVDRNGDKMTVGERQLLYLARAYLKNTKVLVLEEPLATVGGKVESVLNHVAWDLFPSATVLTIAHQMKYVVQCDKVMVIEAGKVVEYDSPASLYRNRDSFFSRMITASTGNLFETEL